MTTRWLSRWAILLLATAGFTGFASADDTLYQGWGPRVGLASDPNQFVLGAHFDLGELSHHVRFVPNVELGLGDDQTVLGLTAPVHYRWENLRGTDVVPYAGGGLALALVDRDAKSGKDETKFEAGLRAIGGAEWYLKNNRAFFIELQVILGDVYDFQAMVGWHFRR